MSNNDRESLLSVPEDLQLSFSGRNKKKRSASAAAAAAAAQYYKKTSADDYLDDMIEATDADNINIKAEVEYLVRIVLPEELDNVDEMLLEFHGREDQLLESLRNMLRDREDEHHGGSSSSQQHDILNIDNWQQELDEELDGSNRSADHRLEHQHQHQLKSPPEEIMHNYNKNTNGNMNMMNGEEEKKEYSSPLQYIDDEDDDDSEHDISSIPIPIMVQTTSSKNNKNPLQLSNLTTQSESPVNIEEEDNNISPTQSSSSIIVEDEEPITGKKTIALVKLRVWDPAKTSKKKKRQQHYRLLKCVTATHILLPHDTSTSIQQVQSNNNNSQLQLKKKRDQYKRDSRKAAFQGRSSSSDKDKQRLSIVKEEPEVPRGRGDSYWDDGTGSGTLSKVCASVTEEFGGGAVFEDDDTAEDDDRGDNVIDTADENDISSSIIIKEEEEEEGGSSLSTSTSGNNKLHIGALVGIQLSQTIHSSSSVGASTSGRSYSGKQQLEWKVGGSINLHGINLLSLNQVADLHYQIENNHPSLRELVLDGLPLGGSSSIRFEEAELLFEALGNNTSIKRFSMRYSAMNDDMATSCALSLVNNTTMTQLVLEGNELTTTSAKNFYSVLKKNNDTLRLLDISNNLGIEEDVESALDQFMEQRALKRMLTNKAEKARRAAKGLPPDVTLDDEIEGQHETDGQVTVVCSQSVIDTMMINGRGGGSSSNNDDKEAEYLDQLQDMATTNNDDNDDDISEDPIDKPYPGEDFRDYMQRIDDMKRVNDESQSYHQKLMDRSDRDKDAFVNYRASPTQQHESSPVDGTGSTGSSITTRSRPRIVDDAATDSNVLMTTNEEEEEEALRPTLHTSNSSKRLLNQSQRSSKRLLNQSAGCNSDFARGPGALRMSGMEEQPLGGHHHNSNNHHHTHPYHNTQTSSTGESQRSSGGRSLDISENDYMDDKAGERAMRDRVARSGGAIGAHYIDEAAPARQNRSGGARRNRMGRSESQRRARLAQLQGGGGDAGGTANAATAAAAPSSRNLGVDGALSTRDLMHADIELANDPYYEEEPKVDPIFDRIGMGDEDAGTDRRICIFLVVLALVLLILVIVLATKFGF